jgi:hypothetical protein
LLNNDLLCEAAQIVTDVANYRLILARFFPGWRGFYLNAVAYVTDARNVSRDRDGQLSQIERVGLAGQVNDLRSGDFHHDGIQPWIFAQKR